MKKAYVFHEYDPADRTHYYKVVRDNIVEYLATSIENVVKYLEEQGYETIIIR